MGLRRAAPRALWHRMHHRVRHHGVHVPASAYDDHVVDERRRKAWRLVGAALLTALVAVAREMM